MQASSLRAGTITDACKATGIALSTDMGRIRYYKWVRRASFLIAALTLLLSACDTGSKPPRIGTVAPDFNVQDSDRKLALNQFRGEIVVLNFWATWCMPCIEEMPSLVQLQQRLKDRGVTVLAVSVDTDAGAYRRFLHDHNISLLTVRDEKQQSNNLYGTFKFPETYIIDRNGVMRRKFIGAVDWSQPEITEFLTKL
jgi:cytochrome c biogenesis protein CcmG, thiol:disulfide interchange protein DsbE